MVARTEPFPSNDSVIRKVRQGANLVCYGRARTGKTTFLHMMFPLRNITEEHPIPGRVKEPFIFETQRDMQHVTFFGFERDVYMMDFNTTLY